MFPRHVDPASHDCVWDPTAFVCNGELSMISEEKIFQQKCSALSISLYLFIVAYIRAGLGCNPDLETPLVPVAQPGLRIWN